MATNDQNPTAPTDQVFDPVQQAKQKIPQAAKLSDSEVFQHISNPANFRNAFPDYNHLSDDQINEGMQRTALRNPSYSPPPAIKPPSIEMREAPPPSHLVQTSPYTPGGSGLPQFEERGVGETPTSRATTEAAAKGNQRGAQVGGFIEAPVASAVGTGASWLLNKAGKGAASALGASPQTSEKVGEFAGMIPSIYGMGKGLINAGRGQVGPISSNQTKFDAASGAAELHDAVNPAPQYKSTGPNEPIESFTDPKYKGQMERQLPRIKQFADDQNHQINSQETLAQAAHGAANAQNAHFQQNVLGPNRNVAVPQPDWYQGKTENYRRVTLGEMYKRLADLNAELDPRYTKGGGGTQASQSAVRSTGEVQQEAAQIRQLLYGELAKATGQTPEQVAESNHAIGELRDIAEKTRGVAGKEDYAANKEGKKGMEVPTSKSGVAAAVINKAVKSGRAALGIANPADRRIANVFNNLDIPSYAHAPINPPTLGRVQNELNMTRASALGQLPTPANNPAAVLGQGPAQGPTGRELANPAQSSPVPAPIAAALGQRPPVQPTGEPLTTPPFAQPYQRGEELGELARQTTAGEKQALNRFVQGNPDPLSRIPVKIQRAVQPAPVDPRVEANTARWLEEYQRNKAAAQNAPPPPPSGLGPAAIERWQESIFNKKPAPDIGDKVRNEPGGGEPPRETKQAEAERLRARLKQLEDEGAKSIPQPERDTNVFKSIQKEHPDWSLSDVAKEAAKRVKGNK